MLTATAHNDRYFFYKCCKNSITIFTERQVVYCCVGGQEEMRTDTILDKERFGFKKMCGSTGFQGVIGRADCDSALGAPTPAPDHGSGAVITHILLKPHRL